MGSSGSSCSPVVHSFTCDDVSIKYELKKIGNGKYGQVFEAKHEDAVYAAKEYFDISCKNLSEKFVKLMDLHHENIVTYYGVYNMIHCDGSNHAVAFMELVDQSLSNVVEDKSRIIDQFTTLSILCDIASGLNFLHKQDIFHCDLIPNNVLVTAKLRAKVSDYGNTRVNPIHTAVIPQDRFVCDYLPPEALEGSAHDAKVDVFSFGHLLMYIILRRQPHGLLKPVENQVARSEWERREKYTTEMSEKIGNGALRPLLDWMKLCVENEPSNRPHFSQLLALFKNLKV